MNDETSLPQGWTWAKLGEVANINPRTSVEHLNEDEQVSFIGMAAVEAESGRMDASQTRALKDVRRGYTGFQEDDVLFAKITPCMENGKSAIARDLVSGVGFGSTEFHVLRPETEVDGSLIRQFVGQKSFRRDARSNMTGSAGQLRVPTIFLENFPFPLAPLAEQKRIAAKLEELLSEIEAGAAAIERARGKVRGFRASLLRAATTGELSARWRADNAVEESGAALLGRIESARRAAWEEAERAKRAAKAGAKTKRLFEDESWKSNYRAPQSPAVAALPALPDSWCWASVEQTSALSPNSLSIGPFGSNLKVSDYTTEGVPLIFVRNIRSGNFDVSKAKFVSLQKAEELSSHCVESGEILITKMGEPPGDSCLYPFEHPKAIITADCIKWRIFNGLHSSFFINAINSVILKSQIKKITKGVAQQKISLNRFRVIAVPLPPIAEQKWIVGEVERRLSLASEVEASLAAALRRASALKALVLARAFRGELCAQDDCDESADALLKRIRAARAEQPRRASRQPKAGKAAKVAAQGTLF